MPLVAGVDSSTQSTKVEVRDLDTGEVVASGRGLHPAVTAPRSEQDPESWWGAFNEAWAEAGAPDVDAVSIGGQQHGMVALDADDCAVHPAKLWNDTESDPDVTRLVEQLGGAAAWADAVGSVPVAAFTITKLSWLRRTHPDAWTRMQRVLLPHDYMTFRLTGERTTDRGDASGTGYWSPSAGDYRLDLLRLIDDERDWSTALPTVLGPMETAGRWRDAIVAPGSGDNMAGALGVGLRPGDAMISIGTSGTVSAVSETPTADPSGTVAGFADATGRFLPLVCTSNAAKVLDAFRRILGVDHAEFDRLALAAEPGGPVLLPYFDGERTPYRPDATGAMSGLRSDLTREQIARAAVDGVACGLLDGLDAMRKLTTLDGRVVLIGGGARSEAMQAVLAGLAGMDVIHADVDEAVATGAAVQSAAVLEQVEHAVIQQRWGLGTGNPVDGVDGGSIRERYAELRDA
ncbi:xylulokinase [Ilumatobacter nonamiensis]|uniref:xylulokinase n=1 Tax=Ilumatobacter nonamiensis TaxID=467093 RepID=UPI000345FB71|nr:xylulokinase [Ilumatobacter nonamiensis]